MKRSHPEDDLQALCFAWLRLARPDVLAWAVPNGGKRAPREAARLRKQGVTPGVADITVVLPDNRCGQIEMKAGKAPLSEDQQLFRDECQKRGMPWFVCRSFVEFQAIINGWCGKRERKAA